MGPIEKKYLEIDRSTKGLTQSKFLKDRAAELFQPLRCTNKHMKGFGYSGLIRVGGVYLCKECFAKQTAWLKEKGIKITPRLKGKAKRKFRKQQKITVYK